jgi:hypothetical protein
MRPPSILVHFTILTECSLAHILHPPSLVSLHHFTPHTFPNRTRTKEGQRLPIIHPPTVCPHKLLARLLERDVWSQLPDGERLPGKGIHRAALQVFDQSSSLVGPSVLSDDGVVHDLEGNAVDEVVWYFALLLMLRITYRKRRA